MNEQPRQATFRSMDEGDAEPTGQIDRLAFHALRRRRSPTAC